MKKCFIIVNAYCQDKSNLNQPNRLKQELEKLNVKTDIIFNDKFVAYLDNDKIISKLAQYDFGIYLDKDKYISQMLESGAIRLFNSHEAIRLCDDKMETYIKLAKNKIAIPKTLSGLLCYTNGVQIKEETLKEIEKNLPYPIVVKCSFGSLGKEVFLAKDRQELTLLAEQLKYKPHLFQEFIKESSGQDIRVIVIGKKPVVAMLRKSTVDFRSNIELGGKGYTYEIDKPLYELCEKVASCLGLDYCGIDVLKGKNGYVICEVNSNAFFGGIEAITGVNVAKIYAEYIYNEIYNKGEL